MRPRSLIDLTLSAVLAVLAALVVWSGLQNTALVVLFGLPLVLFLPGYAFQAAAFQQKRLGWPERIVLSLALSIAITTLAGIVLFLTPWGLEPRLTAGLLALATLVGTVAAASQRSRTAWRGSSPKVQRSRSRTAGGYGQRSLEGGSRFPAAKLVLFAAAGIIGLTALSLTLTPAPPAGLQGYTLLWLDQAGNEAEAEVLLGLQSMEFSIEQYQMEVYFDDQLVQEWEQIVLRPEEKWETALDLAGIPDGGTIRALLYRTSAPGEAYRDVVLRLGSPERPQE